MIIYEKEQQEGKERENLIQTCISRLRDGLSFTENGSLKKEIRVVI
jgi:hypothetical protein